MISVPGTICGPLLFSREAQRRVSPGAYLLPSEMFLLGLGYSAEVAPPEKGRPGKKWWRAQTAIKRGLGGGLSQSLGGVSASPRYLWSGCWVPGTMLDLKIQQLSPVRGDFLAANPVDHLRREGSRGFCVGSCCKASIWVPLIFSGQRMGVCGIHSLAHSFTAFTESTSEQVSLWQVLL